MIRFSLIDPTPTRFKLIDRRRQVWHGSSDDRAALEARKAFYVDNVRIMAAELAAARYANELVIEETPADV